MINVQLTILWILITLSLYQSRTDDFIEQRNSRLCGLPTGHEITFNDCDFKSYAVILSKVAIPALVMIVLSILMTIVYSLLLLCGCCRWKRKVRVLPMSVLIGLASLLIIIGSIITIIGNISVGNNVHDGIDLISETLRTAKDNIDRVDQIAEENYDIIDVREEVESIKAKVDEYYQEYDNTMDNITFYENVRNIALYVATIIPVVLIGLGIVALFFKFRFTIGLLGWLSIFFSIILWISLAAILVASQIVSDLCYEVEISRANDYGLFSEYLKCNEKEGFVGSLRYTLEEEFDKVVNNACTEANEICTNSTVICGDYECKDIESLLEVKNLIVIDNGNERLVSQCPITCQDEDLKSITREVMRKNEELEKANDAFKEAISLVDCEFIIQSFDNAEFIVCNRLDRSVDYIVAGNILQAIGLVLLSIVLIYIFKTKNVDEEDDQDHEE